MTAPAPLGQVVLASAGTGKTFRLTNRYIELLAKGADPASVLATTFTRKAAGEILDRVLDRLGEAAHDERALDELREHAHPDLTHERCADLLRRLAANLHRLGIGTLDAFAMRLASAFTLELGVAPGWGIVEDEQDRLLRARCVDHVLESASRTEVYALLEAITEGKGTVRIHRGITDAVEAAYSAYLAAQRDADPWRRIGPRTRGLGGESLETAILAVERLEPPLTKKGEPNSNWQKAIASAVRAARDQDWKQFLSGGLPNKLISGESTYSRLLITEDFARAFKPLVDHASSQILGRLRSRNEALHKLMERFDAAYRRIKRTTGALRFDDVPRLLLDSGVRHRLHEVYYRLDGVIDHVLLDEFQDTSADQFRLLEPLMDELLSGGDRPRSLFCVGDVKQSLYMWRDARPELLAGLSDRWPQLESETLEHNFRSSPVVIDAVNRVFETIAENEALGDVRSGAAHFASFFTTQRAHHTDRPGCARLIAAPDPEEGDNSAARTRAAIDFAAERAARIVDAAPGASVGVLLRVGRHIPAVIRALAALGVPASEEGGNPVTDSAPVAVAVSLLHLVDHPGDTAALYHVATSPLAGAIGIADPLDAAAARRRVSRLRARLMSDGYAATIADIGRRCAGAMDPAGWARYQQMLDLALRFDADARTRASDFVDILKARGVEAPGRRRVRVMTIHKSKGLEFDAVILPDLDRAWSPRNRTVLTDRPAPLEPVHAASAYADQTTRSLHPELERMYDKALNTCAVEELCCLYVAMTRAVGRLEMIILPPSNKKANKPARSAAGVLRAALTGEDGHEPGQTLWEIGDETAWTAFVAGRERAERQRREPEPAELPLRLAAPRPGAPARLARTSPSALEGDDGEAAATLADVLRIDTDGALGAGSLVHHWAEQIEWLDDDEPDVAGLLESASRLGFAPDEARGHAEAFLAALRARCGAALRRSRYDDAPAHDRLEVFRERPFAVLDASGGDEPPALLSGRFDRLVVAGSRGRRVWAEVIDFKSDHLAAGDDGALAARARFYAPQLEAYRRAAAAALKLDPSNVRATLLFIRPDVIHELPAPPPSRES